MGIGQDIADVVNELGMTIHILERESSPIVESIDYESNTQLTKPFTAEHYLTTSFSHVSTVMSGDLIHALSMAAQYRVMNVLNEVFENSIIYKQCILYKCNTIATVYAPRETRNPDTLVVTNVWEPRQADVTCLITDKLYGSRLDDETQNVFEMDVRGRMLYFPKKFDIQIKDRVDVTTDNVPYQVTSIEENSFPGMRVVFLEEDTRQNFYYPPIKSTLIQVP